MTTYREMSRANDERIRDFGEAHRIREWVVTPEEWDALLLDFRSDRRWPGDFEITADKFVVYTQGGAITVIKGP